jgi:hypothetical protein
MSAEKSWSVLDPRPVLKYIPHCDDYIVYWNGVVMPHKMALCIAGTLLNIFPTPEMKMAMQENYVKLYYANAFGTLGEWDHMIREHTMMYNLLQRFMNSHLEALKQRTNLTGQEILGWFDYSRANSLNSL